MTKEEAQQLLKEFAIWCIEGGALYKPELTHEMILKKAWKMGLVIDGGIDDEGGKIYKLGEALK